MTYLKSGKAVLLAALATRRAQLSGAATPPARDQETPAPQTTADEGRQTEEPVESNQSVSP